MMRIVPPPEYLTETDKILQEKQEWREFRRYAALQIMIRGNAQRCFLDEDEAVMKADGLIFELKKREAEEK